jgi:hypothetical protein
MPIMTWDSLCSKKLGENPDTGLVCNRAKWLTKRPVAVKKVLRRTFSGSQFKRLELVSYLDKPCESLLRCTPSEKVHHVRRLLDSWKVLHGTHPFKLKNL